MKQRKPLNESDSLQAINTAAATDNIGSPITAYWPVMIFFMFAVVFPVLPVVLGRFCAR
jgi:hypothetical protein